MPVCALGPVSRSTPTGPLLGSHCVSPRGRPKLAWARASPCAEGLSRDAAGGDRVHRSRVGGVATGEQEEQEEKLTMEERDADWQLMRVYRTVL